MIFGCPAWRRKKSRKGLEGILDLGVPEYNWPFSHGCEVPWVVGVDGAQRQRLGRRLDRRPL